LLRVYRTGSLARLGHDHVVSSDALHGYALLSPARSTWQADIRLQLDSLTVDDPQLRHNAGFAANLSPAQVDATRKNMMDVVLDATHFPVLTVHAECGGVSQPCTTLTVQISLHGTVRSMDIALEHPPAVNGHLAASACFQVRQSDFGIVPLSVLNGAVAVRDELDVCFDIKGSRLLMSPVPQQSN
jgi:hypothetical protein